MLQATLLARAACCFSLLRLQPPRPSPNPSAEARGDYGAAAASYRLALRLLLQVAHDPDAISKHPGAAAGTATSLQTGALAFAGWLAVGWRAEVVPPWPPTLLSTHRLSPVLSSTPVPSPMPQPSS